MLYVANWWRRWLPAILIVAFVSACLEPYAPETVMTDLGILVVDGFFVPNDTTKIRLSRTATLDNVANSSAEGTAVVTIENENGTSFMLTKSKSGLYVLPPLNVDLSSRYKLRIHAADGLDYSSALVPVNTTHRLDSVDWVEEQTEDDIVGFDIYAGDPTGQTRYYLWSYDETWEYHSLDVSIYKYENGVVIPRQFADELFTCWKTLSDQNVFVATSASLSEDIIYKFRLLQLPQNSRKFAFGYSILVKQYALTEEGFEHWSTLKKNSENLGTLFDPVPSQPKSNIVCESKPSQPAIGHFAASMVQKRRLLLKRNQLKGSPLPYTSTGYEGCSGDVLLLDQVNDATMASRMIHDKYFDPVTFEFLGYSVAPKACLDCRLKGGTIIKPDYWK